MFAKLGDKPLDAITPADCADVLRPIWLEKADTVSRVRQRMHATCNGAGRTAISRRTTVSVVDYLLPKQGAKKDHQPAMPWRDVPAFSKVQLRDIKPGDNTRVALLFGGA
ncbi:hypothetical protein F4827_002234 [Paraburkholderia bannensis]|uniref:Phage integrase central domain-containing protein n=1 Tax=Paraburkholderia bannensis TaxID=765414 RepID=A0A7W9TY81_9BURK|nr:MULTISPECIES: hypothetical protein [Paraburkholderia]MBB3257219.1 hypothetical protein [Paraburkholderia sp. WP4_3_2]MBB6102385.1 hypothetical protein [Paraburkholderia bannensis]